MANQKLPGIIYTIRDGGLATATLQPTTDKLLIIGNALDGPVNRPLIIRTLTEAEGIYGPLVYSGDYVNPTTNVADGGFAENTLVKALHEALLGGAGDVVLVRSGGNFATGSLPNFTVSSLNPGRIYNNTQVTISSGSSGYTVTLVQPSSKGGTVTIQVPIPSIVADLVNIVNNDGRNNTVMLSNAANISRNSLATIGGGTVTLSGGTNGTSAPNEDYSTSKSGYYTKLTQTYGTFDSILGTQFDIANLVGIYADDQVVDSGGTSTTTVAQAFAVFLYNTTKEVLPCHGVIGLRPTGLRTPAEMTTFAQTSYLDTSSGFYDASARWIKFGYFMYNGFFYTDPDNGESVDVGRHLSIVAGPDLLLTHRALGYYLENGSSVYAGQITNLPAQSATTNKPIGTIKSITGIFPKSIHELMNQGVGRDDNARRLGGGSYVTFRTNVNIGRPIVVADNTASMRGSDYQTLQVLRIVNLASSLVKQVLYPFIGEANNVEAKNAMRTQVQSALNKMVEAGALLGGDGNGYTFSISSDITETLLGQVTVTLYLRPALQIRYIKVIVNVTS